MAVRVEHRRYFVRSQNGGFRRGAASRAVGLIEVPADHQRCLNEVNRAGEISRLSGKLVLRRRSPMSDQKEHG